jgi:hypothetical protein
MIKWKKPEESEVVRVKAIEPNGEAELHLQYIGLFLA